MSISFPPPKESKAVAALLASASAAEIDVAVLEDILFRTTAHSELLAFSVAARRLTEVIRSIPAAWSEWRTEASVNEWLPVLDWVADNADTLTSAISPSFAKTTNSTGHNPVRGSGVAEFGFYAVLCELLPAGSPPTPCLQLTAHLLLAYATAMREHADPNKYHLHGPEYDWQFLPNSVNGAARAVRRLLGTQHARLLSTLDVALPPEDFAEALEQLGTLDNLDLERDRHHLFRFLQKCWDTRNWRDNDGGGSGASGGGHAWIGERVSISPRQTFSDDDQSSDCGSVQIARFRSVSRRKASAHLRSDLSPDEDEGDEEVLLGDHPCSETYRDAGALARTARAKSRAVKRSNQLLPWSYERLTRDEVGKLLSDLDTAQNKLIRKTDRPTFLEDAETILVLKLMLATGSDITRAARACLIATSMLPSDGGIAAVISKGRPVTKVLWRIPALRPLYKTDLSGTPEQLRPEGTHVDLPDPLNTTPLIQALHGRSIPTEKDQPLFTMPERKLLDKAKLWLRNHENNGGRISLAKIANVLWQTAHSITGDAALASCVTGMQHPLARVRLHYTAMPARAVQKTYRRAIHDLLGGSSWPDYPTFEEGHSGEATVGARLCPTLPAVKAMFARLRADIIASLNVVDRDGFIAHHNLLTLFAVQFFAYATTCRAIVTPYPDPASVDSERQLATLADKDDESCHKTRLVWMPPALLNNMGLYAAHLESLNAQLPGPPKKLAKAPCFFLDDGMVPIPVRPKTLEPLLKPYLDVRANTHRRFLRTELLERGCNPEVVDAFMGHWHTGEEPFSPYSTFSFSAYVAELSTYLGPLLAEIGLDRPVAGLLSR